MIFYLDTNIVIYVVEDSPVFGPKAKSRLTAVRISGDTFMICDLTRMECLVFPLRTRDAALESQFRSFFSSTDIQVMAITPAVCDTAASIRATHSFKPMDALQLAAGVEHGADVFLTNDIRLNSFSGLKVEVLT